MLKVAYTTKSIERPSDYKQLSKEQINSREYLHFLLGNRFYKLMGEMILHKQ